MFTTIDDVQKWLNERLVLGMKPGLKRMEWLMERLEHPERRLKTIHVAGTNGKGSTVSYLRSILQEENYSVGTFTSPYIEKFNERISINNTPIADEDLAHVMNQIKPLVDELEQTDLGAPTEFEILTAAAIYYFAKISFPDIVIFETGLGGRLDSTNIIHPILTIITNIGYDHMHILGDTLAEIAGEKAGIIKSGVPVITAIHYDEALQVIQDVATAKKAKLYQLNRDFFVTERAVKNGKEAFSYRCPFLERENLEISLAGKHQTENAAIALMAVDYLNKYFSFMIGEEAVRASLKKVTWPGRFEFISEKPLIVLDGAHNPDGIEALIQTVEDYLQDYHIRVLFSALKDKEIQHMVNQLNQIAFRITYTTFDYPRAASAKELFEHSRFTNKHYREEWKQALDEEIAAMTDNEALVVTGSLYFISAVREYLK